MAKSLDQIFEECLERIFRGDTIESCLISYPNEAANLEPLLRTALGITNRAAALQPDPEFKARAMWRLQGAMYNAAQTMPQQKHGGFAWQRSWAFALSAVLLLLFGSVGTALASSNALPDEPLYGTKLATEQVQLAFTFSEENKAALHVDLAEQRAQEMAAMAEEGKTDYVVATAEKLNYQMEQAEAAIKRLELKETAKPVSVAVSLRPSPPVAEPAVPEAAPAITPAPSQPTPTKEPEISQVAPAITPAPTKSAEDSALGVSANQTLPEPEGDTGKTEGQRVERAWENFNSSTSKNLEVLERVMDKSPDEAKPALQKAIDRIKERRERAIQYRTDTQYEPRSHEPDKQDSGGSDVTPRPKSDRSTWKDDKERPVESDKTRQPADIPVQPSGTSRYSDNSTRYKNFPVPTLPTPTIDTWRKPDNTSNESDSKPTSTLPVLKYHNSYNDD